MNEYCIERPASPTGPDVSETRTAGMSEPSIGTDRLRLSRIVFLGTVLVTQVTWLGALAYMTSKLFD